MKRLFSLILPLMLLLYSGSFAQAGPEASGTENTAIALLLDQWHQAAADSDMAGYFSKMTEDAVFLGTDPTENWRKQEFLEWSRPYFESGKAWSFTTLQRNIFTARSCDIAWFDELLDTQMGICRGSGVLVKENGNWKIRQYVLSIAIPNEQVEAVTLLKKEFDHSLISKIKSK